MSETIACLFFMFIMAAVCIFVSVAVIKVFLLAFDLDRMFNEWLKDKLFNDKDK